MFYFPYSNVPSDISIPKLDHITRTSEHTMLLHSVRCFCVVFWCPLSSALVYVLRGWLVWTHQQLLFPLDSVNIWLMRKLSKRSEGNRMIYWVNFSSDSLPTIQCRQTSFFSWRSRHLLRNSSLHDILFSGFRNHFFLPLLQTEGLQPLWGNALHGLIACLGSYQIKSNRGKHCILMHTCGILKNSTDYLICKAEIRDTDIVNKYMDTKRVKRKWEEMELTHIILLILPIN